jgi:hypothetical protein
MNNFLLFFGLLLFSSCVDFKKKEEVFKCAVISCEEIQPSSVHDDINRPLGFRLKTSCGRTFRTKKKYQIGDTVEVTKVTYQ